MSVAIPERTAVQASRTPTAEPARAQPAGNRPARHARRPGHGLLGPTVGKVFDPFGGRPLVLPGAIGMVLALGGFTQVSMTMPYWQVLGLHAPLSVSLAATFTPVFTLGMSALPQHLYSHGSSMLGTSQQVAAAFGTALVVTVMAARGSHLVADGVAALPAQLSGMKLAFVVAAALTLVTVVVAAKLPGRIAAAGGVSGRGELATANEL